MPPLPSERIGSSPRACRNEADDPNLRSIADVRGHAIRATDGDLGRVVNFSLEPRSWTIHSAIVDLHRWWPGRSVVAPVDWITGIDWDEGVVRVAVARAAVRNAPTYRPGTAHKSGERNIGC